MSELFTPYKIGPIELRNRTIRSAAFEAMCPGQKPSKELFDYHTAVARGGIGMTTVAYAAVSRSGLSFENQLWMREEIVPELKVLTDAIHAEGAKASIQLGHCGNMSHRSICGCMPYGASRGFNLYSPTFVQKMNMKQINEVADAYGHAVELAIEAGFDAVEQTVLSPKQERFSAAVVGGEADTVDAYLFGEVCVCLDAKRAEKVTQEIRMRPFYFAPVYAGALLGEICYYHEGEPIATQLILAENESLYKDAIRSKER